MHGVIVIGVSLTSLQWTGFHSIVIRQSYYMSEEGIGNVDTVEILLSG